jgi:Heparinase II/III-like protein/Heparinase II/III N-terminus
LNLRDYSQELLELGAKRAAFRLQWEMTGRFGLRSPASALRPNPGPYRKASTYLDVEWTRHLPFRDADAVVRAVGPSVSEPQLLQLLEVAEASLSGRIRMFGRWFADFGSPPEWHIDPVSGQPWAPKEELMFELARDDSPRDVKFTWEIARFSHACHLARAAAFFPEHRERFADALLAQMEGFVAANPLGYGIHWTSGQEVALRLIAWLFALDVMFVRSKQSGRAQALICEALTAGATWIEQHLDYARIAVYNNHLLSEALGLFAAGALLPAAESAPRWRNVGRQILEEEAERQFYRDGAYIQQSHNYHRVALHDLLWASAFARSMGDRPATTWLRAMERSLDFLVAQQNPTDGRLPNYGANDGSYIMPMSCCDVGDYRPTLQAVSLLVRNERLYEPGPWDETAAWFAGPSALDAPLKPPHRRSVSFADTGFHVLRGEDTSSFAAFRCGSLRDRFSQIDMLHIDVWWRGQNVLVDAGSYRYNGCPEWHNHFMGTGCHNTVVVDGRDQMLHFRKFKVLYWTRAALLRFAEGDNWSLVEGEHYGYHRHKGRVIHCRALMRFNDDLWVVIDRIGGTGTHESRLHWLAGEYGHIARENGLELQTSTGPFTIAVTDENGSPLRGSVVRGQDDPPRGWVSRYYGEKLPAASLEVRRRGDIPHVFVSILAGEPYRAHVDKGRWYLHGTQGLYEFDLIDGHPDRISVTG